MQTEQGGREPVRGIAPGLAGVTGRLGVNVAGKPLGLLRVDDGEVEFAPGVIASDAQGVASFATEDVVRRMLRGQLNPVVAVLQGSLELSGDLEFAVKVILGLQPGSPFTGERLGRGA